MQERVEWENKTFIEKFSSYEAIIIFGILLFILGLVVSGWLLLPGLILLLVGMVLRPGGILSKEQVIDSWSMLIENGQAMGDEVFKSTSDFIAISKAPSLRTEKKQMSASILGSITGAKRDFLVVRDPNLAPYQIFINIRDYGANLDVSWYLTYRPSFFKALLSLLPFLRPSPFALSDLDLFEQQDLKAYATVAHHSTLKAVESLMQQLNQDLSKINRQSKGFLGVS